MAINYALLGKYLAEMYEVQSIEERFQIFSRYLQILGFTGATYTFAPTMQMEALRQLPMVFLRTDTFPTEFLQDYSEKRFDRSDFTVRKVLNGETHPMDWREYELTGELLNEEVELIRLARERYGILNAISIPTTREHGAAGMSVISNKGDDEYKKIKQEQMDTLLAMVRVFHDINFNSRN
ncbi:MAG: autoinducer binding domain-containing protein [Thiofilum sp.]|uniref:autoinducer binding domain-containing protein n=1 Tax=Thiofilum sp. TaxID=2212733 RepID=UPI0025D5BF0F|nr:autoinducer binding domain-containing protein [Thiofilum sp.]MBK8453925.1 autoinducer binding domain-containing protein [Thiofilum sp.]